MVANENDGARDTLEVFETRDLVSAKYDEDEACGDPDEFLENKRRKEEGFHGITLF